MEELSGDIKVDFGPGSTFDVFKETVTCLSDATTNKHKIEMVYRAASTARVTRRKADPYHVLAISGGFYLIGLCLVRKRVSTFATYRIKEFAVLEECFRKRKKFELDEHLKGAF